MKQKTKQTLGKVFVGALVVTVVVLLIGPFVFKAETAPEDIVFGATYSVMHAEELGIDPLDGFRAVVEELGVERIRIPVYWDRIEAERDQFEWYETDEMMRIAGENDVDVVLAIGRRVPRWPECFFPEWTDDLEYGDLVREQLAMIATVVRRYKESESLVRWQVENEPFLESFGECPKFSEYFLEDEIGHVRSLDPNTSIMTTASGELSLWSREAKLAQDMIGVSVYRETYNKFVGYITYPIPAWAYRAKAAMFSSAPVIVSELQAEPWYKDPFETYTIDEQIELFDVDDLERNVDYAERIGFPEVYVWGVEWWYRLHLEGRSQHWEAGKLIF